MRLDPKLVHPSIFKATDAFTLSGGAGRDPKVVAAHQSQWMREYGAAFFAYIVGAIVLLVGSAVALKSFEVDKTTRLLTLLPMMLAFLVLGAVGFMRHMRRLSVAELEMVLPALDLSEAGRAYAETIVALHRSHRPKSEIDETMVALNALLDEEARLAELHARLTGEGQTDVLARLDAERAGLAAKAAAVRDAGARDAYAQSLVLLDERVAGLRSSQGGLERIEAHLALLRQAVYATRDAARRLGTAPATAGPDLTTDALRSAISNARSQTQATEQALAELRAI